MRRIRRQSAYSPKAEDWLFHVVAPTSAYAAAVLSAGAATSYPREAPLALFAAVLALSFTGIHNAWDSVAYLTLGRETNQTENGEVK